jgi:Large ribosomal RNA subunit accumulation protein YceD
MKGASPPLSRPIRVETVPREGLTVRVEADPAERAALAAFNNLPAIGRLVATFDLRPGAGGIVEVSGEVAADVTQTCVVALEPFEARLVEPVNLRFAPPSAAPPRRGATGGERDEPTFEQEESPDPIVDGAIDLGAVAAEFLTLGLDPYPRKPGVSFEPPAQSQSADDSPFGDLAGPKKGK